MLGTQRRSQGTRQVRAGAAGLSAFFTDGEVEGRGAAVLGTLSRKGSCIAPPGSSRERTFFLTSRRSSGRPQLSRNGAASGPKPGGGHLLAFAGIRRPETVSPRSPRRLRKSKPASSGGLCDAGLEGVIRSVFWAAELLSLVTTPASLYKRQSEPVREEMFSGLIQQTGPRLHLGCQRSEVSGRRESGG